MKNKTISKLGFATFLIVAFYIFMVVFEGKVNFSKDTLQFAIDWPKLNKVVLSKNSNDLEIVKSEKGTWELPQKNNFPASEVMMRSLFLKLMDISTSEKIQVSPSGIEKLGLNESGKASGHGIISLSYPESEAGKIFLGALRSRKGETMENEIALTGEYVRFSQSDQVFILPMAINLQTDVKEWLSKDILDEKLADVYEFVVYHKSEDSKELVESYAAVRDDKLFLKDEAKFVLKKPLADGKEAKSSLINEVGQSLENLTLEDVEPSSKDEFKTIAIDGKVVYKLMDGEVIEVNSFRLEERHFVKISTILDTSLAKDISEKYNVFKSESKDTSNIRELPVASDADVDQRNDQFSKWIYEINGSVYSNISKDSKALIEEAKAPAIDTPPAEMVFPE